MKTIIPGLTILFTILALGECFILPTKGFINPCAFTLCAPGTWCIPVSKKRAKCVTVPTLPPGCAALTCLTGHRCVLRGGKATCEPACKATSDCKQQGSYCNQDSGVCECFETCPQQFDPVCDQNGDQHSNKCFLDIKACEKKTTLVAASCV